MTRDPATPEMFNYEFDVEPLGAGDQWIQFINGSFVATGGARRGMGTFRIQTDELRLAGFLFADGADGSLLKDAGRHVLDGGLPDQRDHGPRSFIRTRSPATSPPSRRIHYHHEAQENGQGAMEFSGTDATGKSPRSPAAGCRAAPAGPT